MYNLFLFLIHQIDWYLWWWHLQWAIGNCKPEQYPFKTLKLHLIHVLDIKKLIYSILLLPCVSLYRNLRHSQMICSKVHAKGKKDTQEMLKEKHQLQAVFL